LRKLFREMTDPEDLDAWDNLTEVMNWAADTLNRVVREKFFEKFQDAEAVQYFYEPFLEEFDPELRKSLGVWYTPPEVVKYMVARVDQVLRSDFNRPDGLADPEVFVLDPCCGTGAYLTEVLNTIAATLKENGEDALLGGKLKKAARERIFGFEILPAPFVVAHLQLGLFLQAHGSPLDDRKQERAGVYLTNALTGWQPPVGPKQGLLFPELEAERDAAERVKQKTPILVVIGNPPYNGFAGLPETPADGVTAGKARPELRLIAKPTKTDRSSFNEATGDCDVTARWGICGKGGICMPSNGRTERRPFDDAEAEAQRGSALLGPDTRDVFLNDRAYWKNVPARVWEYTLGGYQVLKKWLSYREKALLGRGLTIDEVGYVQQVARRIAALLLLGPELDENYRQVKAKAYPWKRSG
jgi:hypothetical protein